MDKLRKVQLLRPLTAALAIAAAACVTAAGWQFRTLSDRQPPPEAIVARDARIEDLEDEVKTLLADAAEAIAKYEETQDKLEAESARSASLRDALEDAAAKLKTGTP